MSLLAEHVEKVRALSERMKQFHVNGERVKIYHGSTNSTRAQTFDPRKMVDTSALNNVLEVNEKEQYALVESNVSMDALVRETRKFGLVPPVVPEFPGITVGGAVQGGAGESSSFKYGGLHECCDEYEIVLGNGEIVQTSPRHFPDLFYGAACSYGTLGIVTMVRLRLVPATRYVRLRYKRCTSIREAVESIQSAARTAADFVDGIIFSNSCAVTMVGVRTDESSGRVSYFSKAHDEWFYLHARKIAETHDVYEETVPLWEYLFRYDRGGFWVASYGFRRWSIPFNRCTRYLLNPFLKTRQLYDVLHYTNTAQQFIVQDICLPESSALDFLMFVHDRMNIYPLWLLPLTREKHVRLSPTYLKSERIINVGVWGEVDHTHREYKTLLGLNHDIEEKTGALGGRKVLYAHAYYSRDAFWRIYDKRWYDTLRDTYHASRVFPDIYDKVHVGERYDVRIGRGLAKLIYERMKSALRIQPHRRFVVS